MRLALASLFLFAFSCASHVETTQAGTEILPESTPKAKLAPIPEQEPKTGQTPSAVTSPPAETTEKAPTPMLSKARLDCTNGSKASGLVDRWSPLSTCPDGYAVTGLSRIDLTGDHNIPILHVNDFICDDKGCKAWCIGSGCTVVARCCRISD